MNRDLELAKRVFPLLRVRTSNAGMRVYFDLKNGAEDFDPLGKHFPDVLAWLACQTDVHITGDCVATQRSIRDYTAGTADGLTQAVYEAAIRIVEAE